MTGNVRFRCDYWFYWRVSIIIYLSSIVRMSLVAPARIPRVTPWRSRGSSRRPRRPGRSIITGREPLASVLQERVKSGGWWPGWLAGAVRRVASSGGWLRGSWGVARLAIARVVTRILTRVATIGLVRGARPVRRSFSVGALGGASGASRHFQFEFLS